MAIVLSKLATGWVREMEREEEEEGSGREQQGKEEERGREEEEREFGEDKTGGEEVERVGKEAEEEGREEIATALEKGAAMERERILEPNATQRLVGERGMRPPTKGRVWR